MVNINRQESARQDKQEAAEQGYPGDSADLLKKLEEAEQKAAENHEKYLRAVADLENYKKRAAKEKADALAYGNEMLIRDVLPIIDSLDRAMGVACNAADMDAFKKGFDLVKEQLVCCLGKHGVEKIEAIGTVFNPHLHEALLQVESAEHKESNVVEEFEKGYLLRGRLLKPAKVSVAKSPTKKNEENKGH